VTDQPPVPPPMPGQVPPAQPAPPPVAPAPPAAGQPPAGWVAPDGGAGYGSAPRPCQSCGLPLAMTTSVCPRCGAPQPGYGPGKDRLVAVVLALFLGGLGIHKFYLGKVVQGILYIVFVWTGIPSFIAWIEAILYLTRSPEAWAREYGGPVQQPNGAAVGCLWILALLPLVSIFLVIALIALGGAVSMTTG
jgi:TM2 domain-containing membrane protein YozV